MKEEGVMQKRGKKEERQREEERVGEKTEGKLALIFKIQL